MDLEYALHALSKQHLNIYSLIPDCFIAYLSEIVFTICYYRK